MSTQHAELRERWAASWPQALACWSRYVKLSEPRWVSSAEEAAAEELPDHMAMINLASHQVLIRLDEISRYGLQDYAVEILAHEIGHHVFVPGDLTDHAIALGRARRALPTFEQCAPWVVNLYQDLLINDRLVRFHDLRIDRVYRAVEEAKSKPCGQLWSVYLRAYEILWGLGVGSLGGGRLRGSAEGDAQLMARLVRVFAKEWLEGVAGFAALLFPYLEDAEGDTFTLFLDTLSVGRGAEVPGGLSQADVGDILHPVHDPRVVGRSLAGGRAEGEGASPDQAPSPGQELATSTRGGAKGQSRQPFEYHQLLQALGMKLTEKEAAIRYYKEQALPHLIPFPTQVTPVSTEPLIEGTDPWDIGSPLESVDWLESVLISPRIFPGMTTVQRAWGVMSGRCPAVEPIDLDLYVDCSGSMPNPGKRLSHITVAGAIMVLSALRAGSRVQATLWSGPGQFQSTSGFVRDEKQILGVLVGYLGGGTAFPNHVLRKTYASRTERDRPVHILVLSDEGVDTMQSVDELGNPGMEISSMALQRARGGGSLVLSLHFQDRFMKQEFAQRAVALGWDIFMVNDFSSMVDFAREFARKKYQQSSDRPAKGAKNGGAKSAR